jgi:hypothetical protein
MAKIKRPHLDECSFTKNSIDDGGNHPVVEPGIDVTVRYNGLDIAVFINASMAEDPNRFTGTITEFDSSPEMYDDLSVGDNILFHRINVCSIP